VTGNTKTYRCREAGCTHPAFNASDARGRHERKTHGHALKVAPKENAATAGGIDGGAA